MAGCEPPAVDFETPAFPLVSVRRGVLVVDCVHECEASWIVAKVRELADQWDTEAACTDTHGEYMRSMAHELREITGALGADGVAVASRSEPVQGSGGRSGGVRDRARDGAASAAKAEGRAGEDKRPARH